MGLELVVGYLADLADDEDDVRRDFLEDVAAVRGALRDAGLGDWDEPTDPAGDSSGFDMYGYAGLHYLRRIAAHLAAGEPMPAPGGEDAPEDPVLLAAYERGPRHQIVIDEGPAEEQGGAGDAAGAFDHLIHHNDAEGLYVPIDFSPVLLDTRLTGVAVGSAYRLLDDCQAIATRLGIPDGIDADDETLWTAPDHQGESGVPAWQRYGVESYTCVQLMQAAQDSIDIGAAVVFC